MEPHELMSRLELINYMNQRTRINNVEAWLNEMRQLAEELRRTRSNSPTSVTEINDENMPNNNQSNE